jgi:hypothetical protein
MMQVLLQTAMIKPFVCLFLLVFSLSSFSQDAFNSVHTGKKITDTPLHDYLKEELKGDQLILLIAYGCSHCKEATEKAIQRRKEGLIDELIILGSEAGEKGSKELFRQELSDKSVRLIDYDWTSFPKKFIIPEPGFPNPPVVFFIRNNVIKKILNGVPDTGAMKKLKHKLN